MPDLNSHHKYHGKDINRFHEPLLSWYDRNARVLPWRYSSDVTANPYHVWLSEIMLQQTVVATVKPYFENFINKWPTVNDLAEAKVEDIMAAWAGLGYYARARNLHKCAKYVSEELDGVFPDTQEELLKLPGIGPYTSAAITAIAYQKKAVVVDGNVERVMARQYAIEEPLPQSKKQLHDLAALCTDNIDMCYGDYVQALMDLGATICIPKSPRCMICPVKQTCEGQALGIAPGLPKKTPKKQKPFKIGHVYWIQDSEGRVLLERRADTKMMGGMLGFPTSAWEAVPRSERYKAIEGISHLVSLQELPLKRTKALEIHHSFTHFDLVLCGYLVNADTVEMKGFYQCDEGSEYEWFSLDNVQNAGFPSLFKKFVNLMSDHITNDKGRIYAT